MGDSQSDYDPDRSSGQMLWTFPTGGEIDSSPVICGDKVVFGSADGRIYLLNLDTDSLVALTDHPAEDDAWRRRTFTTLEQAENTIPALLEE